ncbi:MAG TPA: hypothetical protein VI636_10500 [Candidatus Angelobacter sp.]
MPENASPVPPASKKPTSPKPASDAGHIPMTEEMDSAKWTLPPVVPVLIAVAAVAVVLAVVVFSNLPKPYSNGNITKVLAVENADNVLVAIHLNINNAKKDDYLWIKEITSELQTADGQKYTDTAAPAVDLDHYLEAAPPLAEGRIAPLRDEMKIPARKSQAGMLIFAFPVSKAAFDARKSLTVRVDFHDHSSLVMK